MLVEAERRETQYDGNGQAMAAVIKVIGCSRDFWNCASDECSGANKNAEVYVALGKQSTLLSHALTWERASRWVLRSSSTRENSLVSLHFEFGYRQDISFCLEEQSKWGLCVEEWCPTGIRTETGRCTCRWPSSTSPRVSLLGISARSHEIRLCR